MDTARAAFESEHEDSKKQVSDLQYDLIELRDAHAKLRSSNDKLRRERDRAERERDDINDLVSNKIYIIVLNELLLKALEQTRFEQDEEKKLERFFNELSELFKATKTAAERSPTAAR